MDTRTSNRVTLVALENLLRSARYNVTQIDADLSRMQQEWREPFAFDEAYHQGYQNGRKAELESLITTLEMVLA